jgi:tetratricopeptide (TPR) repeat protein
MTENEFIKQTNAKLDKNRDVPDFIIKEIDDFISTHECSCKIWKFRGDLIQLGEETDIYTLKDAENSYRRAIEINPDDYEAYEELGHFFDAVLDDETEAENWFNIAEMKKIKSEQNEPPDQKTTPLISGRSS